MFGLAEIWKRNRPDRLTRLARAIEALGDRDRQSIDEEARVERLRLLGAASLHRICSDFTKALNGRLSSPAVVLDPAAYSGDGYSEARPTLFQINLRGRLLQIEFEATEELYSQEDFRFTYVLRGVVRAYNQDLLNRNIITEKTLFYCPTGDNGSWYYFDSRTYYSGILTQEFFVAEMEELL